MFDVILDGAGVASGLLAYGLGRAVCLRFGARRDGARRDRLQGLLAPYDGLTLCPIPVRTTTEGQRRELPSNVYPLRRR